MPRIYSILLVFLAFYCPDYLVSKMVFFIHSVTPQGFPLFRTFDLNKSLEMEGSLSIEILAQF